MRALFRDMEDALVEIFADQQIEGETEAYTLWLDKDWYRSRQFNLTTRVGLAREQSVTQARGEQVSDDRLSTLSLEATLDHVDTRFRGLNFATLEYDRGFNDIFGAMGSQASVADNEPGHRSSRQGGSGTFTAP